MFLKGSRKSLSPCMRSRLKEVLTCHSMYNTLYSVYVQCSSEKKLYTVTSYCRYPNVDITQCWGCWRVTGGAEEVEGRRRRSWNCPSFPSSPHPVQLSPAGLHAASPLSPAQNISRLHHRNVKTFQLNFLSNSLEILFCAEEYSGRVGHGTALREEKTWWWVAAI